MNRASSIFLRRILMVLKRLRHDFPTDVRPTLLTSIKINIGQQRRENVLSGKRPSGNCLSSIKTRVGYIGGKVQNPKYKGVC